MFHSVRGLKCHNPAKKGHPVILDRWDDKGNVQVCLSCFATTDSACGCLKSKFKVIKVREESLEDGDTNELRGENDSEGGSGGLGER